MYNLLRKVGINIVFLKQIEVLNSFILDIW